MRQFVKSGLVLTVLLLCGLPLPAQEPAPFRDSVEVRVINVDVYVEDSEGNAVHGLSAADFEILEDRRPQPITNFAEYRSGTFVDPPPEATAPLPFVRPEQTRQPRTIVFMVDAFNQAPNVREELFARLRAFTRDGLADGDRAALFNWRNFGITEVMPLTTDLSEIDRVLSELAGMQLPAENQVMDDIIQFHEEAAEFGASVGGSGGSSLQAEMETTIRHCAEEYLSEMERKSSAIERLIGSLSGLEGRKAFVYVAGRFPADTAVHCQSILRSPEMGPAAFSFGAGGFSTDKLVNRVTGAANAAGVTFYPIRPRTSARRSTMVEYQEAAETGGNEALGDTLVMMNDADALGTLAERTGGRLAVGDHMIDDLLPEIISDFNNYYSIGYRATSDGTDREREIQVRMKDRSLRARTRQAFVEKSRLTEVKDQLVANLVGEPLPGDIELEVIVGEPVPGRRGRSTLPVEVRIPLDQLIYAGPTPTSEVRLLSAAGTRPGAITEISETQKRIEQPPPDLSSPFITWKIDLLMAEGGTRVSFAVLDEISGLAGFVTVDRTTESLAKAEADRVAHLSGWERELNLGHSSGKPLLVYFRPESCYRRSGFNRIPICENFEKDVLGHPEIVQRLRGFELIRREPKGEITDWPEGQPGLALTRIDGMPIVRWNELLDGTSFARILGIIATYASDIVRVNELIRTGRQDEGDLATAMLQIRFGLQREGTDILERLASQGPSTTSEISTVRLAFLSAGDEPQRGIDGLRSLIPDLTDATAVGEAWLAVAALSSGEDKTAALEEAFQSSPEGSSQKALARSELEQLAAPVRDRSIIRIAPLLIATGRTDLRTVVQSSEVASVEFLLDGRSISTDRNAPFRATVDLERLPTRHDLRVIARDPDGATLGEDSLTLNGRSDSFWIRFLSPESNEASGEITVELVLQIPEGELLDGVEIEHDGTITAVEGPPYRTTIPVDSDQISVLQARARTSSGATAEDTKILNSPGYIESAGVHLVELPLIPIGDEPLRLDAIRLLESGVARQLEALLSADAAPLTLGLVIDTSGSMAGRILDVQAAAVSLIEQVLRPRDKAFLVSFDSEARLDAGVTGDRQRLMNEVRSLSPAGSTALFDAMMLGLLQYEPFGGRRALIVFSDGDDRVSRYKLEDVAEVAKQAAVPIYLVRAYSEENQQRLAPPPTNAPTPFRPSSTTVLLSRQQQKRLELLTRESGGGFFQLDSLASIDTVFTDIARLVNRQVLLTYLTDTSNDEEWRPIEIRIDGRGSVRAPKGYYARPH